MNAEKSFTQITLEFLLKNFTEEQTFRATDLYDLARRHQKYHPKMAVNNALKSLTTARCVVRDDEIENKHGGSSIIMYRITGKSTIVDKSVQHELNKAEEYQRMNKVQIRLQNVLNNIARNNQALN
jgi:hypothetical protein